MVPKPDPLAVAADAALALAAERPWRDIALRDVAAAARLPMTAFYGVVRSKDDVVDALFARLDRAAAAALEAERPAGEARERVFDAAMARFDAMEQERAGLASILSDELSRPLSAARLWPRAARTARWLLELAGVDTSGAAGAARVQGFTAILARATRAWLEDEAGDLSRTMATLDRTLRDVETWRARLASVRRRASRGAEEPAPDERGGGAE